jgi:hypothetical protein
MQMRSYIRQCMMQALLN